MSSLATKLVTWEQFRNLPDRDDGYRQELHDGEVVVVPPARPLHLALQERIEELLRRALGKEGKIRCDFPYRPLPNMQYWIADVLYIPTTDWQRLISAETQVVYSPPLIVEVLSPSNRELKLNKQRTIAFSAGTQEFWVVDAERKTIHVTTLTGVETYGWGTQIPLTVGSGSISVASIFEGIADAQESA